MASTLSPGDIADFARCLATSFSHGAPLVETLDAMADAAKEGVYLDAIVRIKADVSQGMQLNHTMRQTGLFPDSLIDKVGEGEKVGALDKTFDEVAAFYENLVDHP